MVVASSPCFLISPSFLGHRLSPHSPAKSQCIRSRPSRVTVASYTSADRPPTYSILTSRPKTASLYDVLGVSMGATCQEIKAAYRRLARTCHPDVVAMDQKGTSADEFMKINAAYATLSDPEKKADYDRTLLRRFQPLGSTGRSSFKGFARRTWETDQCW